MRNMGLDEGGAEAVEEVDELARIEQRRAGDAHVSLFRAISVKAPCLLA